MFGRTFLACLHCHPSLSVTISHYIDCPCCVELFILTSILPFLSFFVHSMRVYVLVKLGLDWNMIRHNVRISTPCQKKKITRSESEGHRRTNSLETAQTVGGSVHAACRCKRGLANADHVVHLSLFLPLLPLESLCRIPLELPTWIVGRADSVDVPRHGPSGHRAVRDLDDAGKYWRAQQEVDEFC